MIAGADRACAIDGAFKESKHFPQARPKPASIRVLVVGLGFEPRKAEPVDLQSTPFGRFGTPPQETLVSELSANANRYCMA